MCIRYLIDPSLNLLHIEAEGRLTTMDWDACFAEICRDPDFRPEQHRLIDGRGIERLQATGEQMAYLASRRPPQKDSRRAIVTASALHYGMWRQWETASMESPWEDWSRVFFGMGEALVWLGLPRISDSADWRSIDQNWPDRRHESTALRH